MISKKLSKKVIVLFAVSAVIVIIAIAVAAFLIFNRIEYNDIYKKSQTVASTWNDYISKNNDVSKLVNTDSNEYSLTVGKERLAYENFLTAYESFCNSPITKRGDLSDKFNDFKTQTDLTIKKIDIYFEIINPIHDFVVKSKQLSTTTAWSDVEVDDLVSPLILSGIEKLEQFGQEYSNAAKKLFASIYAYEKNGKYANYSAYLTAKSEFSTNFSDLSGLADKFGAVDTNDINNLSDVWSKLNNAIHLSDSFFGPGAR